MAWGEWAVTLLGLVASGLWLASRAWERARLRRARTHRETRVAVAPWFERPADPEVLHCERCGLPPDPEQRAAIGADPALARVHAEPWRFRVHWYCPRCAPLGATTTSGVAAWDGKS